MKRLTAFSALLFLFSALPVYAMDEEEAIAKAEEYVPEGSELKEAEREGRGWEIEFISIDAQYEITLDHNGSVKEADYELKKRTVSKEHALTDKEIRKILKKEFGDAEKIRIRRKTSRKNGKYYKVTFRTDAYRAEVKLSGQDGTVLEYELKYSG